MTLTDSSKQVRIALASWLQAFNARDLETLMSFYDPEIVYANAEAPLMRGIDQVRPWFAEVFQGPPIQVLFREETLFVGDRLALLAGKFHFRALDSAGESTDGGSGRVSLVYRLSDEGRWLLLYDTDNNPPDCSAADFADSIPSASDRSGDSR